MDKEISKTYASQLVEFKARDEILLRRLLFALGWAVAIYGLRRLFGWA